MVHRFASRCQFGPGISRFQILECEVLWGGVECLVGRGAYVTGPEPLVAVPGQLKCVLGGVLLSRTLAGAVPSALSGLASGFGMDTGRFPVAVTTETTTWAVLDRRLWCGYSVIGSPVNAHCACVGGWVGCGPYSGRFALLWLLTPAFPRTLACVVCGGVVVCVGLLVPVSSQTVTGLPLLAYQPSSLLGAYQKGQVLLAETLS